jgi:hypothetical protein
VEAITECFDLLVEGDKPVMGHHTPQPFPELLLRVRLRRIGRLGPQHEPTAGFTDDLLDRCPLMLGAPVVDDQQLLRPSPSCLLPYTVGPEKPGLFCCITVEAGFYPLSGPSGDVAGLHWRLQEALTWARTAISSPLKECKQAQRDKRRGEHRRTSNRHDALPRAAVAGPRGRGG